MSVMFVARVLSSYQSYPSLELASPLQVTHLPLCGIFYLPWHREKEPPAYSVFARHRQCGVNKIACFKTTAGGIEPPSPWLTVRRSTVRPLFPTGNKREQTGRWRRHELTWCSPTGSSSSRACDRWTSRARCRDHCTAARPGWGRPTNTPQSSAADAQTPPSRQTRHYTWQESHQLQRNTTK